MASTAQRTKRKTLALRGHPDKSMPYVLPYLLDPPDTLEEAITVLILRALRDELTCPRVRDSHQLTQDPTASQHESRARKPLC